MSHTHRSTGAEKNLRLLAQADVSHLDKEILAKGGYPDPSRFARLLEQADLTSATGAVLNKILGRLTWPQVNPKTNAFGALPTVTPTNTRPYSWRAKSAFASTGKGGVAEGTIPTAVVSTYKEVTPTIKEHATQMRVSSLLQDLQGVDDAYGRLADVSDELSTEHAKEFERAFTEDIDTLAGVHIESLDRITASSTNQATIGWTAGDEDIYGLDRSTETWANANQTVAATATNLLLKDIDNLIQLARKNLGVPTTAMITGWDTWKAISGLLEGRGRFEIGVKNLSPGGKVNDADIPEGLQVSTWINGYNGIPIVASDEAHADTDELSRIYGVAIENPDGFNPLLAKEVIMPTQVYTVGEKSTGAPQAIGFLGDSVLAVTRMEPVCRGFKAQWQLRDRTSPE